MNVNGLKKALPVCFKSNVTMLITGPHGAGKSQGVRQAIEGQGIGKVWDFRLGQMADTGDIIGLLDLEKSSDFCEFKMPKRIFDIIQYCIDNPDKYGVLFFDEMNRTTKDILQAIFEIVLDNSLNGIQFPDNMRAICAINPATDDYAVLDFDDKAFADRFCHVKFEPSVKDWLKYAKNEDIDPSITGFIGEHHEALEMELQDFDLPAKPSRRSWFTVDRLKKNCPDNTLFTELLMGMVGADFAHMYLDYVRKSGESIKGIEILNDYKTHRKKIKEFSGIENNREDLLNVICGQIKTELEKIEQMSKVWEKNVGNFFCDIPRDLAYGHVNDLFEVPSFISTENDPENGMAGDKTTSSKKLIKHFQGWQKEETKTETKDDTNE